MLRPQVLLPIIKKDFPGVSEKELINAIMEFGKAHPELNDATALIAYRHAQKHPDVVKTKNIPDVHSFLNQPKQPVVPVQQSMQQPQGGI